MDKTVIVIILVIILAGVGFWVWQSGVFVVKPVIPTPLPEGIVLFYGQGCSHCKIVDDFIAENKIIEKIKITQLEVWFNKSNAALLGQVAVDCKIDVSSGVGVPFLYDGNGKCYVGDVDAINFLKNETESK